MNKARIYDLLKAKYFINDDAVKNWTFILFLIILALMTIANTHSYEKKVHDIAKLTKEVKQLRSECIEQKSYLNNLKMESNIAKSMEIRGVFPSNVPPVKIKAYTIKEDKWYNKIWK